MTATATPQQPPPSAREPHPLWKRMTSTTSTSMNYVRALLYGPSGIGKTTSIRTLPPSTTDPKSGNEYVTLILKTERSMIPLADRDYRVIELENWQDVSTMIRLLQTGMTYDGKRIHTLVIDSLTGISDLCKLRIVEQDRPALLAARAGDDSREAALTIYEDQMGMEDWGAYGRRMKQAIAAFARLPMNVVMTSLEAWTTDKRTNRRYITPALNGKLALDCPADFDLVLYMTTKDEYASEDEVPDRFWQTFHNGQILCKDASGTLNPYEVPDWPSVMKKVKSGRRLATTTEATPATEAQPENPTTTEE